MFYIYAKGDDTILITAEKRNNLILLKETISLDDACKYANQRGWSIVKEQ